MIIKEEPEPESQDENDEKNASVASSCNYNLSQFKSDESNFGDSVAMIKDEDYGEDSDEDMPLVGFCFLLLSI